MDKLTRQREIVKNVATEPWVHSLQGLAKKFGVNQITLQRDLEEMKDNGFQFKKDGTERLYLHLSGWNGVVPVKAATLRQMEILRMLTATPQGLTVTEIYKRFNRRDEEEVSSKTLERAIKDLAKKNILKHRGEEYVICSEQMLPPLQLAEQEKTLLLEALNVARALAPFPDEMKTLEAKLKLWIGQNTHSRETIFVHGRTPTQDVHRSQCCFQLEEAAQNKKQVSILYRKEEEPARQLRLNPLGIVYYWVLDNWYLIAQDERDKRIKTYLVNRILDVTRLPESFAPIEGFDLKTWYQYAWGVYRDQNPIPVRIKFHNYYSTLNRVRAELAKRKTCTLVEDGEGLLMEDQVEGLDELAVWLRGFGAGAEVLEPPSLREKVTEEFSRLQQMYGGDSHGLD
ncbi:helix-turn-helix transcriptional regulator [Desulfosporosinus nitroreducens]|uniref:helix-turn-helix transcriptional regulator n=1 Tax=Desulfosporosinus nitroreducens TaxID=2018668 RepID=UPI00207C2D9D|nr:WYL domain-containing protein [Desulfosporosinus nitroreducens]MCO1600645.1 WYL domain-containing protein [Desulfosporosinus nitroreducens]